MQEQWAMEDSAPANSNSSSASIPQTHAVSNASVPPASSTSSASSSSSSASSPTYRAPGFFRSMQFTGAASPPPPPRPPGPHLLRKAHPPPPPPPPPRLFPRNGQGHPPPTPAPGPPGLLLPDNRPPHPHPHPRRPPSSSPRAMARVQKKCGHYCSYSYLSKCCSCMDERPIRQEGTYSVYVDGRGWMYTGQRSAGYCPVCK